MEKYRQSSKIQTSDLSGTLKITLKTLFGLENVLKEELLELGYNDSEVLNRAVQIKGTWKDVYFLNLHSRCTISILVEVASFRIKTKMNSINKLKKLTGLAILTSPKHLQLKEQSTLIFSNIANFLF